MLVKSFLLQRVQQAKQWAELENTQKEKYGNVFPVETYGMKLELREVLIFFPLFLWILKANSQFIIYLFFCDCFQEIGLSK